MTVAEPIYSEFIDFLAGGFTPQQIVAYKPSAVLQQKFSDLLYRFKQEGLSEQEQQEFTYFLQLEHIIRMAKARARKHL
jgi:hypothetical protein